MRTYLNEDGIRVTDTRIITEEFGMRHYDVMRVVNKIKELLALEDMSDEGRSTFNNNFIQGEYKKYENSKTTEKMFYLSEYGFTLWVMQTTATKNKVAIIKLFSIRKSFLDEFFRLREENQNLKEEIYELTQKDLNDITLPDTYGKVSKVNGLKREYLVRGYNRSKNGSNKNAKKLQGIQKSLFDL